MDFALSDEQRSWRQEVRRFAQEVVLPRTDLDECNEFPWDLYEAAFEAGLVTACLPASLGGGGRSFFDTVLMAEELGYADLGVATSTSLLTLATGPLMFFGTDEQQERWIRPLCESLRFASFAWTEPEGSTNLFGRPASTVARPVEGGGYRLQGTKSTISNASVAKTLTVFARLDPGPRGLSCFVLDAESEGVTVDKPHLKMGQRAADTANLHFDDVAIGEGDMIGRPGQGAQIAVHSMQRSRIGICAMAVGVCRRARDLIIAHGHERSCADGKQLIEQQDYRLRIAEIEAEIEMTRALCWRAAWEVEHGKQGIKLASSAKLIGGNVAVKTTNTAIEMLGAAGYMKAGIAEKLYRDAKVLQIYEGPQFVQKTLIADTATRRGRIGKD